MTYYRSINTGEIISAAEGVAPDKYTEWEQISEREYQNANQIAALTARVAELEAALESLQFYVGNPSAWESYDEDMSERIRRACEVAEPKFWMKEAK